jgi:hypothetical protein
MEGNEEFEKLRFCGVSKETIEDGKESFLKKGFSF